MPNQAQDPLRWETSFSNRLSALGRALDALCLRLEQWGADDQARYLARLAVEELGTNILKYGYDDPGEHIVHLRAVWDEPLVRIELEDDGHEFDPCQAPEPSVELSLQQRTPGGWGISLVRRLLPGMEYERHAGRNLLRLVVPRLSSARNS
jgi:serine/threonine-protein kinase RsbW